MIHAADVVSRGEEKASLRRVNDDIARQTKNVYVEAVLCGACASGQLDVVEGIVDQVQRSRETSSDTSARLLASALLVTCRSSYAPRRLSSKAAEIASFLVDRGADANYLCGLPLLTAVESGDAHLVKVLLEKGADPGACDRDALAATLVASDSDWDTELLERLGFA